VPDALSLRLLVSSLHCGSRIDVKVHVFRTTSGSTVATIMGTDYALVYVNECALPRGELYADTQ
jgi:hypothetical protein